MTRTAIHALFVGFEPRLLTVTLLPPLARRLGSLTSVLYPVFGSIPSLRTLYYDNVIFGERAVL